MNKLRYRVIFSAARGMLIAVQETARSAGKAAGTTAGAVGVTAVALLAVSPAHAQIAGDPNAPGNQRPTVLAAPNGVPVVNIVTPSAAGVSRNVYRQFDVNTPGAILNNSRTAVQSQLGGYIAANPWLARGSARVILNEVNSSSPSYLRGYVEVAGPKAEVIIANPSGIQVQGGGFINSSRVTLTTGVPQLNAYGGIESYRVTGGSIGVSGNGLDFSGTEFAALYARMVSINGGVWGGGELRVVTGANQIGADGAPGVAANVAPIAGTGPAQPLAFDSGALGGMYAQKIWIMGTEAGVGARNAGSIQTGAGDAKLMGLGELTVTSAGRIENVGTIQAAGAAVVTAPTFENSGKVMAAGGMKIATQGDLSNVGGTLEGQRVELASAAGDVNNSGTIRQTGAVGLTLVAPTLENTHGGVIGYEPMAATSGAGSGSGSDGSGSSTGGSAGGNSSSGSSGGATDTGTSGGSSTAGGNSTPAPSAPITVGTITAAGAIRNNGGQIYAGGPIELQTPNVSNAGGKLEAASLAVSGPNFSNAGGTLKVTNGFSANVDSFDNNRGQLTAGSVNVATTGDLRNDDGSITSNGDVGLQVGGMMSNQRGTISATGALDAQVSGEIRNTSGLLVANQSISIQGRSIDNTLGTVASTRAGALLSFADVLTNSGQISAATDLSVRAGSLFNTGTLRAESDARIAVANALSNDGSITAGRNVTASAAALQGGSRGVMGAGIDAEGRLGRTGDLIVTTTGALVAQGTNLAADDASLQGASVDLSGSQTGAANIAIAATQGDVTTSGATVATAGTLGIRADTHGAQTLVNLGGELNAGQLDLHASNIDNSGGGAIVQTGAGATTIGVSGSLKNANGRIASNGHDLTLQAAAFSNTLGRIEHAGEGTLSLEGGGFEGAGGTVVSNGALAVGLSGAFNQDSGVLSARQVTIDAARISNREGEIVQTGEGATHIAAIGVLDNTSGKIASNGTDMDLAATTFINKGGTLQHAGTGTLALDAQGFDGAGGRIASNGALVVQAGDFDQAGGDLTARQVSIAAANIDNSNARITQLGDGATRIAASGRFDNSDGQISTNGHDLNLSGGSVSNARGAIAHAGTGTMALDAGSFEGNAGSIVSNGSLVVRAGDFSQDDGSMAAQQIRIDAANLSNRSGTIVQGGNGATRIAVTGTLQNTSGRIATNGQDLVLRAATLQNSNGAIEHAGAGTFNLDVGTYSATRGRVISNGALAVSAGTYAQDGGVTLANQITIDATDIANVNGAEIVQVGNAATHITATGTLKNDGGRIASNGADMTLKAGAISNAHGHLQHAGTRTMTIDAGTYAGTSGEITSNGALVVHAGDFEQTGGVTTADQVTIDAVTLSNRAGRIIQTGAGATRITVAGVIDNGTAGMIASNGDVSVYAGSLLNQSGTLRAAGASNLQLTATGLVDNSNGGEIGAGGNLALSAGSLRNDAGRITAVGNLAAQVAGAASNRGGTLAANGDTTITAGSVDNTGGIAAAVKGALRISTSGTTVNVGGTMQAGEDVALTNDGFDNSEGKVFGNALSIDTRGNRLSNTQGTLAAATTVVLNSGALLNDAGLIQSGGAMTVNTNGQALSNTHAAGHASGKGGITSAGTLDLATGGLDNRSGYIGSKDALTANTAGVSNSAGGIVFSQSRMAVNTHGATYDNTGGQTQAVGDLSVNAGSVKNAGGLFRSGATTTLTAGTIDNTGTQGTDQGIEGRNVALNVDSLDNTSGAVRSDVDTIITSGGNVNNTNGLISAGETLRIADPNAANPAAKTLGVVNTGGVLTANKSLQLDAARFSADGTVSSGRDLSVALTQDIVNNGEVSANGNLSYVTTGKLTNNGKLLAGQILTASGNLVENTVNAEMSGTNTIIKAGTLNNRGLIDSQGQTRIDAGTVNNIGTGRIYGDAVAIGAGTLNNVAESAAATIAARSTLDIGADTINNRDGALIFSAGDIYIGGALDANGFATGKGSVLNNESATVESLGDMSIAMANVNNVDTHLQVVQETRTEETSHLTTLDGRNWSKDDTRGDPFTGQVWHRNPDGSESLIGFGYLDWQITQTTTRDVATNMAAARLAAGGIMSIDGHLLNRDSKVTAGGALTATSVDNRATQGQSVTSYSGLAMGYDGSGAALYPLAPYSDPARTIDIGRFEYTPNTNATAGYSPGSASGVNGPGGSAGQTGGVSGSNGPGTVIEVALAVSGSARADGAQAASMAGRVDQAAGSNAIAAPADGTGAASGSAASSATGAGAGNGATGARDIATVVRTSAPDTRLPTASLFQTKPGAGSYLIETDPRFANYRHWLGSDYLLNAMGIDPNNVQKRLGDGFYEQKLIREQVAQLTGYRYLDGFTSDEDQYTALMNAGATFAQKYQLTPGIALTAEQMAQLTSDIVWLVEQTVTLPDGSTQRVLVPQVYVRVQPGDIDGSGALLSADRLTIKNEAGEGDFTNSGTVAGRSLVSITADNVNNLGGRISGGNVALDARADINVIGGTVDARDSLALTAGNDINIRTTTSSSSNGQLSQTRIDRVAGVYVTNPGGTLVASAGRDVNLVGAILENKGGGGTSITAKRDINLDTVTESSSFFAAVPNKMVSASSSRETGSTIATNGTTILSAGQDINARQADVNAGSGLLIADAGRNLNIMDGQAKDSSAFISQTTKKGTFSTTTTTLSAAQESTTSVGSSFQGGLVSLHADNNVNIVGSHISGTQGVSVTAGNELNVVEGRNTHSSSASLNRTGSFEFLDRHLSQDKKTGDTLEARTNTAAASSIASSQGGVYLEGGNSVYLQGAQVEAAKNLTIKGGEVTIAGALNESGLTVGNSSSKKSGVSSALHGLDAKGENVLDANVGSLTNSTLSGANISITATGDNGTSGAVTIAGTTIDTPGTLKLEGDSVNLALQSTESSTSHTGGKNNLMWQSTKDAGTTDETLNYNRINAGSLEVNANRVTVGMNAKDSVEALAQQPGMEWIGKINNDPNLAGKIDWQAMEAAHKQWDYGKSGLTPEGAAVVTAVVTYLTWGAASTAGAAVAGSVGGGAAVSGAVAAGISALASQAAVALINNKGDLGKTFDDLGSSASVKSLVTAIVTGGVLGGLNLNPTGLPTTGGGASEFMSQLGKNLTAGAAKAVISTAINGGSLEDALKDGLRNALLDTAAAQGASWIGKNTDLGSFTNFAAHAIAGCAAGAGRAGVSSGGGCAAGAVGAALGEAAAIFYNKDRSPEDILLNGIRPDTTQFAAMISSIGVAIGGGDANEINLGANAGANAAANNFRGAVVAVAARACLTNASCMALVGITAAAAADLPRRTAELVSQNEGMTERAAEAIALSEIVTNALLGRNTTTSGSTEPKKPSSPTVLPAPDRVALEFDSPPLESPHAMKIWIDNVLEGVSLDEAQAWAKDFITTLPAAQQLSMADLIMASVKDNAAAGSRRQVQVADDLQAQYPSASVQNEQYLRDKDGNIAIDPLTGTGRRLDHVVIQNGKVIDVVETTSLSAKKEAQIRHEENTRAAGGTYVLDRDSGQLVEIPSVSRIERRP